MNNKLKKACRDFFQTLKDIYKQSRAKGILAAIVATILIISIFLVCFAFVLLILFLIGCIVHGLLALPIYLVWNFLVVIFFDLPSLSFVQCMLASLGISVVLRILGTFFKALLCGIRKE
jgi:hypothetical protein